jgi:hypothetical protein
MRYMYVCVYIYIKVAYKAMILITKKLDKTANSWASHTGFHSMCNTLSIVTSISHVWFFMMGNPLLTISSLNCQSALCLQQQQPYSVTVHLHIHDYLMTFVPQLKDLSNWTHWSWQLIFKYLVMLLQATRHEQLFPLVHMEVMFLPCVDTVRICLKILCCPQ